MYGPPSRGIALVLPRASSAPFIVVISNLIATGWINTKGGDDRTGKDLSSL